MSTVTDRITVAVIYSDIAAKKYICDFLKTFDYEISGVYSYGFDYIDSVINGEFSDFVICDSHLYDMDASQLILRSKAEGNTESMYIVAMSNDTDSENSYANNDYRVSIPFDYVAFDARLKEFDSVRDRTHSAKNELKVAECTRGYLNKLGLTSKTKGYIYICAAMKLAFGSFANMCELNSKLYPEIAVMCGAKSVASVERAIRIAVETAWLKGDLDLINEKFSFSTDRDRPSNGEFLALMYQNISHDLGIE